jgi:hypothetical protein
MQIKNHKQDDSLVTEKIKSTIDSAKNVGPQLDEMKGKVKESFKKAIGITKGNSPERQTDAASSSKKESTIKESCTVQIETGNETNKENQVGPKLGIAIGPKDSKEKYHENLEKFGELQNNNRNNPANRDSKSKF